MVARRLLPLCPVVHYPRGRNRHSAPLQPPPNCLCCALPVVTPPVRPLYRAKLFVKCSIHRSRAEIIDRLPAQGRRHFKAAAERSIGISQAEHVVVTLPHRSTSSP